MDIYEKLSRPPKWALKQIGAGRLKGKTDINPQWRYQAMTEEFGLCGDGWKYEIEKLWLEPGPDNQVFAFAQINLYYKKEDTWHGPIPGIGGNMLVTKERNGLYANDEAYKMAITDALSTAMKMIGVGAAIYAGSWDGAKYTEAPTQSMPLTEEQINELDFLLKETKSNYKQFCRFFKIKELKELPSEKFNQAKTLLEEKLKRREQGASS